MQDKLNKHITDAIKGIALILMFVHHFFTFPDWYVAGVSYPELSAFAELFRWPLKICVPVFAFFTGYFYFLNTEKTFRYSVKKISDLLISYWFVYIPFLCFAILVDCFEFNFTDVLYEMFALKRPIMIFCWYVSFYCSSMILMPMLAKNTANTPIVDLVAWILFPNIMCIGLNAVSSNVAIKEVFDNIRNWFPCVASGYLIAKYRIFDVFDNYISGINRCWIVTLGAIAACAAAIARYFCDFYIFGSIQIKGVNYALPVTMDILYAPVFIYGCALVLQFIKIDKVNIVLRELGKQSLLMWFAHCLFFNVTKNITQNFLYFPKNPLLVLIFGLLLCYLFAVLLSTALKPILKKKNELIYKKEN